jgi:hypothetical protein
MATAATRQEKNHVQQKQPRMHLTPTGLLMEGDSTTLRLPFTFFGDFERKGDVSSAAPVRS